MSVISSLLNYNLKKKHWNPVTKRGTQRSSPPQPGLLKKWNADQSTIPLTFCSEHWQIQETQGISQCPLSNQYDRHRLFTLTRASYHSQTFFYFPFTNILKRNCWTCLMSDSLSRLATLVTRLGQLHPYRYPCPLIIRYTNKCEGSIERYWMQYTGNKVTVVKDGYKYIGQWCLSTGSEILEETILVHNLYIDTNCISTATQ